MAKTLDYADLIESCLTRASGQTERLPQAILSKALRGELVPTEADLARAEGRSFESAEEMLKRVQSEPDDPPGPLRRDREPIRRVTRARERARP